MIHYFKVNNLEILNRIDFKKVLLLSAMLFSVINAQILPFTATEILGRPTNNSISINLVSNQRVTLFAEYGISQEKYLWSTDTATFGADSTIQITISGLVANTQYFYRLRYRTDNGDFSEGNEHFFHTARPRGEKYTFIIHADPHLDTNSDTNVYKNALSMTLNDRPDFLIDLGDNFMCEKLAPAFNDCANRVELFRSFYQKICHSIPLFLVQGNHDGEYGTINNNTADCLPVWVANLRKKYFFNPHPDAFYLGDTSVSPFIGPRDFYYAFEWGDALFVMIDPYWNTDNRAPNDDKQWNFTLGKSQYDWFKNVLERSTAKFKFVFAHQLVGGSGGKDKGRGGIEWVPFYESGGKNLDGTWGFASHRPGWEKPVHQLMVENNVSVYFHGHDHLYAKQQLDGIIYQECPQPSLANYTSTGSTDDSSYTQGDIKPNSGYLRVIVSNDSAEVEYVRVYASDNKQKGYISGKIETRYTISNLDTKKIMQDNDRHASLGSSILIKKDKFLHIRLPLSSYEQLKISIVDMNGKVARVFYRMTDNYGACSINLNNSSAIHSGTYFVCLKTKSKDEVIKAFLLR